jgi:N-acetylglucosaminyldiphosphoundecaprenol N-acetyl-beta-D-mannosaminyltransferase
MQVQTVNILGVPVSTTNMGDSIDRIQTWIREKNRAYVCVSGVHGIMECQKSEKVRTVHNSANLVVPDGMPLVYISRLAGHKHTARVYGPDLLLQLCKGSVAHGFSHFFFGTTPATLSSLQDHLVRTFPGLRIVGTYAPPFRPLRPDETAAAVSYINACAPDIVWVGLSTPKQECWMAENRPHLNAPVLIGIGAAFDFHAGKVPQAPRWMQPLCLEWFFRLMSEPRRLWKRYLLNNPHFLWLVMLQALKLKTYKQPSTTNVTLRRLVHRRTS